VPSELVQKPQATVVRRQEAAKVVVAAVLVPRSRRRSKEVQEPRQDDDSEEETNGGAAAAVAAALLPRAGLKGSRNDASVSFVLNVVLAALRVPAQRCIHLTVCATNEREKRHNLIDSRHCQN
jgi:hypothetical protein